MQYEQIIDGYYEDGEVKGIDMLNYIPLTKDFFKTRPDMKQRVEKAINTKTCLAAYQRGTRLGYKFITKEEANKHIGETTVSKVKVYTFNNNTPPEDFYIDELKWRFLVRNIEKGKNIMMTGPSGCGKTDATFKAAKALDREVIYFNLGATQDPRSTLIGNTHYNKDEGTYFSESSFIKAIQQENAVILLDELSRAHPEAWNILMTVLDPIQRYLRLDEKSDSPTIKVAEGVSFIATANIGSEYTATRIIDRALLDRFAILEMDVLSYEQEYQLLSSKCNVNQETLLKLCDIIKDIRKEVKSDTPRISTTISTRATLEIVELLTDAFTLEQAIEILIYPLFSDEGGNDSERTYVKQVVQKYLASNKSKRVHGDPQKIAKNLQNVIKNIGE